MSTMLYIDSLREGLIRLLTEDERVFLLGEDIADPYGGSFKVTKSLSPRFPDRLLSMPMSEQVYTGFAVGMALGGLKPIVEIMFGDFLTLTIDQILNHASKFAGLYDAKMHLIVRTPMGGHRGYGATHSQSIERLAFGIPNVDVVAPSILHDPGELLIDSIFNAGIVIFVENKLDYASKLLPNEEIKQILSVKRSTKPFPLGISEICDSESDADITIISYGGATSFAIEAQQSLFLEEEVSAKVISPSLITNLDIVELMQEIGSSHSIIIAEEGIADFGWGEHVATLLRESGFKGNIRRIGAQNKIIGASEQSESDVLLTTQKIKEAVYDLLRD